MINPISKFFLHEYQVNAEGGIIYVDNKVKEWLESFKGDGYLEKSSKENSIYEKITRSGFSETPFSIPKSKLPKISVIIVLYNSKLWIENLEKMFNSLSDWLYEIVVVDNGSTDNCLIELEKRIKKIKKIQFHSSQSFASAVNHGVNNAIGDLFLIINPDIFITKSAFLSLINSYFENNNVGAISPKLLLMRLPGFLNGIGNIVQPFYHGYDLGLGHLDLGQFDHITRLQSACFATILIPKESWIVIGELDESYPMYYEDADWCYRANDKGKPIIFSPESKVYHAFRDYSSDDKVRINTEKIYNITFGRGRFIRKNLNKKNRILFSFSYCVYDVVVSIYQLIFHQKNIASIIMKARTDCRKNSPKFFAENNSDRINKEFLEKQILASLEPKIKNGKPVLIINDLKKIILKN